MTPELWQRLKPLYNAALDLPMAGRSGYVEQMCGRDPELARELMALLSADGTAANTLEPPFHDVSRFLRSRPSILEPGTVLAGRFRTVRHLGSGGMGDVYEALDLQMEQGRIALKTVRREIADDPAALARFKEEVRLARQVTGPNVCRIHELYLTGTPGDAHCSAFLTMELLEGITLHERIAESSPLPMPEICAIAEQLCAALCCIHEAGIVHRDLKPRNVMLAPHQGAQRAVVMDFGLARAAQGATDQSGVSIGGPGLIVGTPSYMAPEQFEGGQVSAATDIYALGLILYELATGVQPFAAHTPLAAAVRRARRPETASVVRSDLPPAWDEVISRCLKYDPALRFQSASEVLTALKHPKRVVLRLGHDHRFSISRRYLIAACFALPLMLAIGIGLLARSRPGRQLSPEAAHWNTLGMTALREGSYLKATRLLTMVTERDPKYPVAHAALADAWTELDFTDAAQREMLRASAPAEQGELSEPERRYIDAVRNTLIRDYAAAAQDYEAILAKLPEDRKAQGYIDLGRAYEKAGRVRETVDAYEKAAAISPDDPAPFLHLGILRSRLREHDAATDAFNKADFLYHAESDQEGVAEVAYQRGYAANEAGQFPEAKRYLNDCLSVGEHIPNVQMEVRTLSQLSSVAYRENQDQQAMDYANRAMQMARENGLEYWSTDALTRQANAYMNKEDFGAAEPLLQQALHLAQQNGHPHLEANTQLSLGSMRAQQKRWDEQIGYARSALKYFQDYGFMNPADKAETLILRAERDKGNFAEALQAGNQLLEIASRTRSRLYVELAQESIGNVLLRLERYPEALGHFEEAVGEMKALGHDPGYPQLLTAQALWQTGEYGRTEAAVAALSPDMRKRNDPAAALARMEAEISLSKNDPKVALDLAQKAEQQSSSEHADTRDLDRVTALAQAQLGHLAEAREAAARLQSAAKATGNQEDAARAEMVEAQLDLQSGDPGSAKAKAAAAEQFFTGKTMEESAALSLLLEAQAAQRLNDPASTADLSRKCLDVFGQIKQAWGASTFRTYSSRPDRHASLQTLARLRGESGDVPAELLR